MNTAMDDGRHESLGEQTLSIPRLTDETLAAPHPPSPTHPDKPHAETADEEATPTEAADDTDDTDDTETSAQAARDRGTSSEPSAAVRAEASGELSGAAPAEAAEEASADPDDEPQEEPSAKTDAPGEPDEAELPPSDTTEARSSDKAEARSSGKAEAAERPSTGEAEGASAGEAEAAEEASSGEVEEELPAEAAEELMAALGALRESVADVRFGLDLPGAEEARQTRTELLAQLEDYVLPRVRTRAAPALIVVAGSTGAGKSTLVNSLAEKNISRTGVRRPTTGTPVLACHPGDRAWFVEGDLLRGLRRLDRPSPDAGMSSLVVVTTEKLPQGVALLDTPDIDSVVEEHHEVAHRMLDAADLWIFVTTAARYADAPAWNLLRLAKERGARLAIVLSRVQPRSREVVLKHFVRMLTEYGLGEIDRFVINESKVVDGRLPDSEVTDLRMWLAELSVDEARRAQAVKETLTGVLNSFRTRVPALAKHLETQVAFRSELRADVETAYRGALADVDRAFRSGSLLHGEVLARWQDFTGSGELMRSFQLRRRGKAARQAPERLGSFRTALRSGVESVIVAAATRAAEEVVGRWRRRAELGATLAEGLDRPSDDFLRQAGRAIAAWQDHVGELVSTEGVAKRSVSKLVSFDPESLSLIFMVAMFSGGHAEGVPHRLVNALLGAESLRGIGAKALSDLRARIGMLFDEESMRYVKALDSAGVPDESIATRLYQATYNLEVVR